MKKLVMTMALALGMAASVNAVNITIADGVGNGNGWYGSQENQEVEPGCYTGQVWDMESFDLTGNTLTMTGGYNFASAAGYDGFKPGDIFFDINGGGYDYVATVSGAGTTHDVYKLGTTLPVHYAQNVAANPWKYDTGGQLVVGGQASTYSSFSDNAEGTHYTLSINLGWLDALTAAGDVVTVHNTMQCGNDNLMGQFTVPDGGSTLALFGLGTLGLVGLRRKM
jgi:hypothetical protein